MQSSVGLLINGSDVIVFDLYNRYVKVLDDVNIIRTVLTLTPGAPVSGAFDSQKNLFFTDLRNNAIWRLTPNRIPSNFIGNSTLLPSPAGIIIDPCQNLLVISNHAGTGEVTLFSPSGVARILAGKRNGTAKYIDGSGFIARFSRIENLVQDRMGNIYIPDKDNHVIRKISFT